MKTFLAFVVAIALCLLQLRLEQLELTATGGPLAPIPWSRRFRHRRRQHPPTEIGPDKNVKWKVASPSGSSSPVIVGDMILLTAFDDGKLFTVAYNRADGHELWRAEAPAAQIEAYQKTEGTPAASSCASDGQHVVSYFGSCGLFCYDLAGKELWRHELPTATTLGDFRQRRLANYRRRHGRPAPR